MTAGKRGAPKLKRGQARTDEINGFSHLYIAPCAVYRDSIVDRDDEGSLVGILVSGPDRTRIDLSRPHNYHIVLGNSLTRSVQWVLKKPYKSGKCGKLWDNGLPTDQRFRILRLGRDGPDQALSRLAGFRPWPKNLLKAEAHYNPLNFSDTLK